MYLDFVKLSGRWFVDIPWDGMIEDLEMVSGSDLFLDILAKGNKIVSLQVVTGKTKPEVVMDDWILFSKVREDEYGAFYKVNTYEYKGEIWLCNVTKTLFSEFPEYFLVKKN